MPNRAEGSVVTREIPEGAFAAAIPAASSGSSRTTNAPVFDYVRRTLRMLHVPRSMRNQISCYFE
jgi:hypothetical protein